MIGSYLQRREVIVEVFRSSVRQLVGALSGRIDSHDRSGSKTQLRSDGNTELLRSTYEKTSVDIPCGIRPAHLESPDLRKNVFLSLA